MSHTIYDLKYHFAELGNKVGDGSSPEMSKSNKYKSGNELLVAAKSSKSVDSKVLIDRLVLLGGKCIFGKMMRLSSSHLIFIPMWCWYKESVILSMNVRSHLRMLGHHD